MAEAVFSAARAQGRRPVRVRRIATADYPTPARRPANSRLDNAKLEASYGIALPQWRQSLDPCVRRLVEMN
jgi:dTDP-4-dehydrorhamnose reductase